LVGAARVTLLPRYQMGSQKARVDAGTHVKPGQQGGKNGEMHCIPLGVQRLGQRYDATARGLEARMVTASIASTAKFLIIRNTNISFSFHFCSFTRMR